MTFALVVTLVLLLGGSLWLGGDLDPGDAPRPATPRLHTVDLEELLDSALEAAGSHSAAPPALEEEVLLEPAPFVESPVGEQDAEAESAPRILDPPAEGEPAPVVVAARDQDAWAALIRRMLALHRRAGTR